MFFGYQRSFSVTELLSDLTMSCFENGMCECVNRFQSRWFASCNNLIANFNIFTAVFNQLFSLIIFFLVCVLSISC